jgi:hypothetical protein
MVETPSLEMFAARRIAGFGATLWLPTGRFQGWRGNEAPSKRLPRRGILLAAKSAIGCGFGLDRLIHGE